MGVGIGREDGEGKSYLCFSGGGKKKIGNNVIEIGVVKDMHQLTKFYSMADIFIICSQREVFPTTCIEAQCCGTSIAGFDAGGAKETFVII